MVRCVLNFFIVSYLLIPCGVSGIRKATGPENLGRSRADGSLASGFSFPTVDAVLDPR